MPSYVRDGVLHIRPTLTADRFGQDFLYNGTLDLWPEGCNVNYNGGCVAYVGHFYFQNIHMHASMYSFLFLVLLFSKIFCWVTFKHHPSFQEFRRRHHQPYSVRPDAHH